MVPFSRIISTMGYRRRIMLVGESTSTIFD